MIEVAPETACILYLGLALSLVLIIWLFTKKKEIAPFHREMRTCEFCQHSYLEEASKSISRCPQCQLLSKKPKSF